MYKFHNNNSLGLFENDCKQYLDLGDRLSYRTISTHHKVKEYDTNDVYIIGGESLYHEFLPLCDTAIITKINYSYEADAYFPNLDKDDEWECVEEGEEQTCFDMEFIFTRYERKKPVKPEDEEV